MNTTYPTLPICPAQQPGESAIEYSARALIFIMQTRCYTVDERGLRGAADAALLAMHGASSALLSQLTDIRGVIARLLHAIEQDRATPAIVPAPTRAAAPLAGGAKMPRNPIVPIMPTPSAARRF